MREAGGHEFESPHPRTCIFRVKNRVTCDLCEGLPGIFKFFFDADVPPL
jgi:hypothetical protein